MSSTTKLYVFIGVWVSLGSSALILLGLMLSAHDPEPIVFLPFATGSFGVALGACILDRFTHRRSAMVRPYPEARPLTPPKMKRKEEDSKYCKDCGKVFAIRQKQTGFDPKTGKPKLSFELGCPVADPNKTTPEYQTYGRYPIAGPFMGDIYLWPNCGDTKVMPLIPVGHNHAQPETKTDCPKCIEDMLSAGIIDLPSARKLMSTIA